MIQPSYNHREQTAVKHEILARYLAAFVPIVGDWASDITYIDCLAGPWESADPLYGDTSFGRAIEIMRSARKILESRGKSPTMRCLFIEKDQTAFNKLKQFCNTITDIEVTPQSWDFTEHISDIVRFAKSRNNSFPFVFIDPKGWETLQIDLIAPILELVPGEVLINFMTSWITRFLSDKTKHFERIFPADWARLVQLRGEQLEDELVYSFKKEIHRAGSFKYVCALPVMKTNQDAFHFYMLYGTRHVRGVEVFKETEKHVIPFMHETRAEAQERERFMQTGQYSFLDPAASYRESKFTRHRQKNIQLAKGELQRKLQAGEQILYDDAWASAMQYSGVLERDLQHLLNEWKTAGLVEITNETVGQKFPQKGRRQHLLWRLDKTA